MNRALLAVFLIAAVVLTVAGAAIQGGYSNRWGGPSVLPIAGKKLATVAEEFGDWRMRGSERWGPQIENTLQCAGYFHRTYENRSTGQTVNVAVLVGPPGPTSVHIPEICYSSKAYEIEGKSRRVAVNRADGPADEFWAVTFRSLDPSVGLLRVNYAWSGGDRWVAPENPRITMRKHPALYKIQLAASLPAGADPQQYDPCQNFLKEFLPVLDEALVKPSSD